MTRNIKGERFGRLTAIEIVGKLRRGNLWRCVCDCGGEKRALAYALRSGQVRSCGCLLNEMLIERNAALSTHRHTVRSKLTPEYISWMSMKTRCLNPNHKNYDQYGGAGVTICKRWDDFQNFLDDMGPRPKGTTLDRVNTELGYSAGNCRWATSGEQNRNVSRNVWITFNGQRMVLEDWASRLGITHSSLRRRLANWPLEDALTRPRRIQKRPSS